MELLRRKNVATEISFPMLTTANPETFDTGETVTDTAYYHDGGSWTSLAITDTVSEIGSTGMYQLSLTATEMNHDLITIKLTSTNAADQNVQINTLMHQGVNAEVLDVMNVDTHAEPGQGAPAATATIFAKINYLYKQWRNKSDGDDDEINLYNDAGTVVDQTRSVTEAAGLVTKGKIGTGP